VLGLFFGVHLLDLTHFGSFSDLLGCNNLRFRLDFIHSCRKTESLLGLRFLYFLRRTGVPFHELTLLLINFFLREVDVWNAVLGLIFKEPGRHDAVIVLGSVSAEASIYNLCSELLPEHFLSECPRLGDVIAVHRAVAVRKVFLLLGFFGVQIIDGHLLKLVLEEVLDIVDFTLYATSGSLLSEQFPLLATLISSLFPRLFRVILVVIGPFTFIVIAILLLLLFFDGKQRIQEDLLLFLFILVFLGFARIFYHLLLRSLEHLLHSLFFKIIVVFALL